MIELELEVFDVKAELKIKRLRGLVPAAGMALMGAAIVRELRKPAAERTWHGQLWGRVPYELRLPTLERLRTAYWAPENSHVFTDTPFGVGWTVNLGRLAHACARGATARGTVTDRRRRPELNKEGAI